MFISSASGALTPYRTTAAEVCHRLGMVPVHMESFDPQRPTPAEVCRKLVDGSDVFVLLIGRRYGSRPSPDDPSYTELEYGWAVDRPEMPLLPFIVDPRFPWPPDDVSDAGDAEALERFVGQVTQAHVVKSFTTVVSFREDLLLALRRHESVPAAARDPLALPAPPSLHAMPPYVGSAPFTGRAASLSALDEWGRSGDTMMVVEAIGGTGKSALTWEWATQQAPQAIPALAGRLWWSFYDGSPSLTRFLLEVLAYVSGRTPDSFRHLPPADLADKVRNTLRQKPYLLILDGFERLLNAYHRFDPSKIRDDTMEPTPEQRSMIDPHAEDIIRQLVMSSPSKILISSRLMPTVLNRRGQVLTPGVRLTSLPGLNDEDARILLTRLGVRGSEPALTEFFSALDNHPLLLGVVAGLIRDYRRSPGDFDRWLADPSAGGGLQLGRLNLHQRRTHILEAAFDRLSPASNRLLGQVSVLSGAVDWSTLEAISPFRDQTDGTRADAQLDSALRDLEERGLLWWNRFANSYDMHPIIRAFAYDRLEATEEVQANVAVRDHFSQLPPENTSQAASVDDMYQTITIFRALIGSDRTAEAERLWQQSLSHVLLQQIGAYPTAVELLSPLATRGDADTRADFTIAHLLQGRYEDAIGHEQALLQHLAETNSSPEQLLLSLNRLSTAYRASGRLVHVLRLLNLSVDILDASGSDPGRDRSLVMQAGVLRLLSGKLDAAQHLLDKAQRLGETPVSSWDRPYRLTSDGGRSRPKTAPLWFDDNPHLYWLELTFRTTGALTIDQLLTYEGEALSAWHRLRLVDLRLRLLIRQEMWDAGLDAAEQHLRLALSSGFDATPATVAYILARTGRDGAASAIEETLARLPRLHPASQPHLRLAQAYLELGQRTEASRHADLAYRQAWGSGPPNYNFWDLREATDILTRLSERPPHLEIISLADAGISVESEVTAYAARLRGRQSA